MIFRKDDIVTVNGRVVYDQRSTAENVFVRVGHQDIFVDTSLVGLVTPQLKAGDEVSHVLGNTGIVLGQDDSVIWVRSSSGDYLTWNIEDVSRVVRVGDHDAEISPVTDTLQTLPSSMAAVTEESV